MYRRTRWPAGAVCGLLLAAALPIGVDAESPSSDPPHRRADLQDTKPHGASGIIIATFHGFRNARGQALVAVYRSAKGFPDDVAHAAYDEAFPLRHRSLRLELSHVAPGPLALAVQHDEDADFEMDTGLFGIPREGFGTSRNAKPRFGPPDFEDARVELSAGQQLKLRIRVRYF